MFMGGSLKYLAYYIANYLFAYNIFHSLYILWLLKLMNAWSTHEIAWTIDLLKWEERKRCVLKSPAIKYYCGNEKAIGVTESYRLLVFYDCVTKDKQLIYGLKLRNNIWRIEHLH